MATYKLALKCNFFIEILSIVSIVGLLSLRIAECSWMDSLEYEAINCRKHSAVLTEFGGKGDGETSNTAAFKSAIHNLSNFAPNGGAQLIVPPGRWLTGPFNLTIDHFTLYLHKDAVLLASQDEAEWPIIDPLPSYGQGNAARRYGSLIFGANLTDIVITGNNGTIDGQGSYWWEKFRAKELKYTRPYLIELMHSHDVQISNLTLINSPFWHVHPVYSRDIIIQGLTILAPTHIPNTDGINPDSCINTRIEDCYIVSGDDCVAIKSGWDEYGIQYGMPTRQVIIKRLTCISPHSAVIAIGSEISGGIQDVRAEDITAINSESGIRIKTARGRGAYVKDIFVKGMTAQNMKYVFWMTGAYKSHPDHGYNPKALPRVQHINFKDMEAKNVTVAADLAGIDGDPFTDICISNVTIELSEHSRKKPWNCTDVTGHSNRVSPKPCDQLPSDKGTECAYPESRLLIDNVQLKTCIVNNSTKM